jgi:ATP-dependent Clp endopeptidase proteolytic subunit ClpP
MRYSIRAEAGKPIELDILDVIADGWFGVSARNVVAQLRNSQAETIKVRINSIGGEVTEGFAIYELLKEAPAKVEVEILGLAASVASLIAMAGDKISIGEGGFVMIHNPTGFLSGESDDFRRIADLLDNMQSVLADVYVARTGQSRDDVLKWMDAETYMTATQALERGFVDYVIPAKKKPKKKPKAAASAFAIFNEADLEGAPEELLAAVRDAHAAPTADPTPTPTQDPPAPDRGGATKPKEKAMLANITKLLALSDDADEGTVLAAINKLKVSAKVGADVETLVGASGPAALGAVRALKVAQEANAELATKVAQLQVVNARRDFESARDQGLKDKKLTPAVATMYTDRFEGCLKDESVSADARAASAEAVAGDLKGFLAVAPRIVNVSLVQPPPRGGEGGSTQHNGKAFEAMNGPERRRLKDENPDLYQTMRDDALSRRAI